MPDMANSPASPLNRPARGRFAYAPSAPLEIRFTFLVERGDAFLNIVGVVGSDGGKSGVFECIFETHGLLFIHHPFRDADRDGRTFGQSLGPAERSWHQFGIRNDLGD